MDTLAALFPVARPQGAASLFLVFGAASGAVSGAASGVASRAEGRARLAEAVALAFAVREPAPSVPLARL